MVFSQQSISPSPLLVQSTLLPQTSQVYLLPSWLAIWRSSNDFPGALLWAFYFSSMGVWQQAMAPSPPLVTMNSEPHLLHT